MVFDPTLTAIRFGTGRHPSRPEAADLDAFLAPLSGPDVMAARYPMPGFDAVLKWAYDYRQVRKDSDMATIEDVKQARAGIYDQVRLHNRDNLAKSVARYIETQDPFRERLSRFWADHFTVIARKFVFRPGVSFYVNEAIRPNMTGTFGELLRAAVLHPMMLFYLDQSSSIGPNSRLGKRKKNRGLNENLAREVLELHTLGVSGGYTQADVRQLAEAFTGLTLNFKKGFVFDQRRVEPGAETVLGKEYGGGKTDLSSDLEAIYRILDDLAVHPDTAAHICGKLAVHFVSDTPDPDLVGAMTQTYVETGGALMAVYRQMVGHAVSQTGPLEKVKQPFDLVASGYRALGLSGDQIMAMKPRERANFLRKPLLAMGQSWESPLGPDGWPEGAEHWITPQGLAGRIAWAQSLERAKGLAFPDPRDFVENALGSMASAPTRFAAAAAETRRDGVALVLVSPDFQRR